MPLVVIVERDAAQAERLTAAATAARPADVQIAQELPAAIALAASRAVDVLVLGPSLPVAESLSHASALEGGPATVLVASSVDAEVLRTAMRAGFADVVGAAEPIGEISSAIERAHMVAERERRAAGVVAPDGAEGTSHAATVLTVFSTKGGVGKTVLATNIAVALAQETAKRVAIVDLDLEFGDVAIMLGLKPSHTIFDAIQSFDRLDADMLSGLLVDHSSGVRALLAPIRPEDAESISAARVGRILDLMRADFDYIVVDTCPSFSESVLAALDRSDGVYVITMMDVASIKNTRISLQKLRQLGYDNGRVKLVLNRSDSKVLLAPREVEDAVASPIAAFIPSDRIVPRSVNKGVPVVLDNAKSGVSRSILALAREAALTSAREVEDVA